MFSCCAAVWSESIRFHMTKYSVGYGWYDGIKYTSHVVWYETKSIQFKIILRIGLNWFDIIQFSEETRMRFWKFSIVRFIINGAKLNKN